MKNRLLQVIIMFCLIGIVAAVGAYSVITTVKTIKSKMVFKVATEDVSIELVAALRDADGNEITPKFTTETTSDGLTKDVWEFPPLVFRDTLQNPLKEAVLELELVNRSNNTMTLTISGIAYDKFVSNSTNYRFITNVSYADKVGETEPADADYGPTTQITGQNPNYEIKDISGGSSVVIKIDYKLVVTNSSFKVDQNINFVFSNS